MFNVPSGSLTAKASSIMELLPGYVNSKQTIEVRQGMVISFYFYTLGQSNMAFGNP